MKEWLEAKKSSDISKFYDSKYKQSGFDSFRGYDWEFFFRSVRDFVGKPRPTDKWLDCGCGHGEFLGKVISNYHFSSPSLSGIDISSEAILLANERFKNYPYNVFVECLEMDEEKPIFYENFDLITSWGSIEHSVDPLSSISRMFQWLKPGGFIMITVPLEFEGCLNGIKNEPLKNNERFMTYTEWYEYFSQIRKPILTQKIELGEYDDMFLVFKK